jgi:hypothetical protein
MLVDKGDILIRVFIVLVALSPLVITIVAIFRKDKNKPPRKR